MKKIILLLATVLLFTTCNRYPYYPFNQDAKEFFIFKKGSWWLYENEQTHERDCLYIENDDFLIKAEDYGPNHYYDRVLISFSSTDSIFYGNGTYYSSTDDTTRISETIYYKDIILSSYINFPLVEYGTLYQTVSDGINYHVAETKYINDEYLVNMIEAKGFIDGNQVSIYILNTTRERNIGLVKYYRKKDNSEITLNLIDYNVIY